jgi:hypothetical protein
LLSWLRRPSTTPSTLIPGAETLPAPQIVVKAPSEPAQPGDFRQSWGKADPHQPTPIARGDLNPVPRKVVIIAPPPPLIVQPPAPLPTAVAARATPVEPRTVGVPVPVDESNAFTDPPKRSGKPEDKTPNPSNAFGDGSDGGRGAAGQRTGSGPSRPIYTAPPPPQMLDPYLVRDMHNAFTVADSSRRMIPADAGSTPMIPNAFSPGTNGNGFSIMPSLMPPTAVDPSAAGQRPADRPAAEPRQVASSRYGPVGASSTPVALDHPVAVPSEESQSAKWLVTLSDSDYPSEREWAAERLGRLSWRAEPQIVTALVKAAREDVAPTVRAACIRTLARMKANTPQVLTQVRALQDDSDARVRQEVEQALGVLLTEPTRRPE